MVRGGVNLLVPIEYRIRSAEGMGFWMDQLTVTK